MLVKMIIFFVDLMLASAIAGTLYALYLIVAMGTFILAVFYIFKGDMRINYDLNKDRSWVLESRNATRNPQDENTIRWYLLDASQPSSPWRSLPSKESDCSGRGMWEDFQKAVNN